VSNCQGEATKTGSTVNRIVVAFEASRDGFWLARWLRTRGIEAYVIHPTSIPVSREHRRAKTDRLDTGLLMRAVLGWLRGEPKHCSMAAIPTIAEEDARRPNREHQTLVQEQTRVVNRMKSTLIRFGIRNFKVRLRKAGDRLAALRGPEGEPLPPNTVAELRRDMARLHLIREQIKAIEEVRLEQLKQAPRTGTHPMLLMLAQIMGIGVETADMLVHEVLSRKLRDQRAVARYAGLTGSPDESGIKRREKGTGASGKCQGPPRHDPTGLAVAHAPEKQRARAMVSNANGGRQARPAENHDRRLGPQAADRTMALRDDGRGADRRGAASGDMSDLTQTEFRRPKRQDSAQVRYHP
jgi:transposase